eukprot:5736051-Pyramimonas_sp.AAC.1
MGDVEACPHSSSNTLESKGTTASTGLSPPSPTSRSPVGNKGSAEPAASPMGSEFSFRTSVASFT